MPRPPAMTHLGPTTMTEMFHDSLDDYLHSLSDADKLAFLNKVRDGSAFNFTPTS